MAEIKKKYWSPGKEHKVLRSWIGTWKTKNSFWVQAGAPPTTNEGEARFRMLLKGRYLSEQFSAKSEEMGECKGQGTIAFGRATKEYTHTWIDSMSSGMMVSRGKNSADGSRIEYTSTVRDEITYTKVAGPAKKSAGKAKPEPKGK